MIRRYTMRFGKWLRYATGKSYQHVPQGVGQAFRPWALEGYFNDLTGKAQWVGATGAHGVPVVQTDTDPAFSFPIVVFQWALGNWDAALLGRVPDGKERLLQAARWAAESIDERGGWSCWHALRRPTISFYSAMAQGEGLSVLARAAVADPDGPWRAVADRAYHFLMNSGAEGLTRRFDGILALEEYPGEAMPAVLNGWMFALIGIVDYAVLTQDPEVAAQTRTLAADLARALPRFDTGYWSTYDLAGNLASPFYHDLHIAQLDALVQVFPEQKESILRTRDAFARYRQSRTKRARAIAVKIGQKLRQADVGEMREAS
ncbi:D-glucuronyl C5-epimerase family protein [Sphingomonas sp. DT-51]|uniref:D-glucuronyl C5-epimerase family protein n=1 Tax=Sphingomonas sp. DT-51 TaxID=3396165 RepID=UPI003F1B2611